MYKAPLPVLPMHTSGCGDNPAKNFIGGFHVNEIDILHPVLVGEEETEVVEPEVEDWCVTYTVFWFLRSILSSSLLFLKLNTIEK